MLNMDENSGIDENFILKNLGEHCSFLTFSIFSQVDSTNTVAKDMGNRGETDRVVIAGSQTAGRGRWGRCFYSPSQTGIYMSLLLRLEGLSFPITHITPMAAVAVCQAIETIPGMRKNPKIKWVNDVYMDHKKVCGILTEASSSSSSSNPDYVVVGVGMNVFPPENDFPQEMNDIAGAIFPHSLEKGDSSIKNRLIAGFLNYFMGYYQGMDRGQDQSYIDEYRKRSLLLGKDIDVLTVLGSRSAKALAIDEECRLVVEYATGEREALSTGEVSIRTHI